MERKGWWLGGGVSVILLYALWRPRKTQKLPPGLVNVGNSCYLNSVIQAICMLEISFADWTEIMGELLEIGDHALRPPLTSRLNLQQQDAHEFLIALLSTLRAVNMAATFGSIYRLAPWEMLTSEQIRCCCGHFGPLQIQVTSCLTLMPQQCISLTLEDSFLEGYRCELCHLSNTSCMQRKLIRRPKILFIHIQRLCNTHVKDETFVEIPKRLGDYRLCSMIEHLGGAVAGHYVAYRRWKGTWIRASDAQVTLSSWSEVAAKGATAYLLVYQIK